CLVAEDHGKLVGFVFGISAGETCSINVIFVEGRHRRMGVGTKLLRVLEDNAKKGGTKKIVFSGGPRYQFAGVDWVAYPGALEFFSKNGYKEVHRESVAMSRSLMDYKTPADVIELEKRLINQGYSFQQLDEEHVLPLLQFLRKEFRPWDNDARLTLEANLMDLDYFTIALKEGEIIGYCQIASDGLIEHFGPFGVSANLRSRGIGAVLFHKCLRLMQSKGARHAWFLWGGGRNYTFYTRHGMKEMRRFAIMSKELK
ncbi:MAG TPA: GNAT family N-acetyltransferase, partial [Thermoproteota archaeon]|nr:GNAT family N-acetyltransferase [Thermoproteota archaeon]